MKKFLWIIVILLLILLVLLAWLLWCSSGDKLVAKARCFLQPSSSSCHAKLDLGASGYSVWSDGSIAVAVPILNDGGRVATNVAITDVTLSGASRAEPLVLPMIVGQIIPTGRAVLQTRFSALAVPGSYTLALSGLYADGGPQKTFSLTAKIKIVKPTNGPIAAVKIVLTPHKTSGVPTPPSAVHPDLNDNNALGPPVPRGPIVHLFPVKPTHTGPAKAPPPGQLGQSAIFIRDTASAEPVNAPPDPSTAVASVAGVVLSTANSYLLYSKDDGQTFTQIDPTTIFPQDDGGLCCDQVIIYNPGQDLFFWLLQYSATAGGTNRLRIAYAHPADLIANPNSWNWFDVTQATVKSAGGLDYPDIAFTNSYLYVNVNGSDATGAIGGLIVARFKLSEIVAGGPINGAMFGPGQSTDMGLATASRLSQNSPDAMYWAGHIDNSDLEVFRWADTSDFINGHSTVVNTYCSTDFAILAPDGQQWLDNKRAAGTGAIVAATRQTAAQTGKSHGEVWFGWAAARDDASCSNGRPQPYVDIVHVDDTTLDTVGEYDIWNTPYAFSYPSLATAPNGDIGVSVAYGGPNDYATSTVGYLGDYVVYYVEPSDATFTYQDQDSMGAPAFDTNGNPVLVTRFGDMFAVRNSGSSGTWFSSLGYNYKFVDPTMSTDCNTAPGCTYRVHYEQWQRGGKP
ncbi:MAG: hypothetical protein HY243_14685 [Proteobacteria bacterium]|nr:hypothetical protein [Pseudomonadota bacterium]